MFKILWNFGAFIILSSVLITVHEFGHFWIAKYFDVQVERFSIGFGKTIWRYINRHNTEFIIAMVPLGGYVKMLQKSDDSVEKKEISHAFNNKKSIQRAAIIAAGPLSNFIFAIFIYWIIFIIGEPSIRPVVDTIVPNSIAEKAQITPGMEIKAIDGIKTPDWDTFQSQLINKINNNSITISVSHFGSYSSQDKILNLHCLKHSKLEKENLVTSLGILPLITYIKPILQKVQKNSAASKAGLQEGDRIIKVNGKPLIQWMTFVNLIRNSPKKPILLEVERKGTLLSLMLVPEIKSIRSDKIEGFVGIAPKIIPLPNQYQVIRKYDPFNAFLKSIKKTWKLINLIFVRLKKLIVFDEKLSNLNGPISIAYEAGISAEYGIIYYLIFLAMISINIGIINLLPIPILDGGNLLFLIIEKFNGRLISESIQTIIYRISLIVLMLLMGIALFNDFSRL